MSSLPHFEYEKQFWDQGFQSIAGFDEVGRGPLAGPVVAAACILPREDEIPGIRDSKKLSKAQITEIYLLLTRHPQVHYALGFATPEEIDQINIRQASLLAMKRALGGLKIKPDILLVDGRDVFTQEIPSYPIIKGDMHCMSIAAASILAKYTRDELMRKVHSEYPMYQFDQHFGYPTTVHLASLKKWGPCEIHRMTFSPVKQEIEKRKQGI